MHTQSLDRKTVEIHAILCMRVQNSQVQHVKIASARSNYFAHKQTLAGGGHAKRVFRVRAFACEKFLRRLACDHLLEITRYE